MLLKCSKEQVRKASNEESIGTELVKQIIGETREALESKTQRGFRDISSEETPPDSTWVPDEGESQETSSGENAGTVLDDTSIVEPPARRQRLPTISESGISAVPETPVSPAQCVGEPEPFPTPDTVLSRRRVNSRPISIASSRDPSEASYKRRPPSPSPSVRSLRPKQERAETTIQPATQRPEYQDMGQLVDDLWKDQPHQTETSVP